MSDKPTYWEYLFSRRGRIVRAKDGQYFERLHQRWQYRLFQIIRVCMLAAVCAIFLMTRKLLELNHAYWANMIVDFTSVALAALFFLLNYVRYRLSGFMLITHGGDDYRHAVNLKYHWRSRIIAVAACTALTVFILNSFGGAYLRSLFDNGQISSVRMVVSYNNEKDRNTSSIELSDCTPEAGEEMRLIIPEADDYSLLLHLDISSAPDWPELCLDGAQLSAVPFHSASVNRPFQWNWLCSEHYFKQYCYYTMIETGIHDGSTLTLTCGDIIREWVFDVKDEEAS